jgi:hypothetical protein
LRFAAVGESIERVANVWLDVHFKASVFAPNARVGPVGDSTLAAGRGGLKLSRQAIEPGCDVVGLKSAFEKPIHHPFVLGHYIYM